jgi:hypothetical protein
LKPPAPPLPFPSLSLSLSLFPPFPIQTARAKSRFKKARQNKTGSAPPEVETLSKNHRRKPSPETQKQIAKFGQQQTKTKYSAYALYLYNRHVKLHRVLKPENRQYLGNRK